MAHRRSQIPVIFYRGILVIFPLKFGRRPSQGLELKEHRDKRIEREKSVLKAKSIYENVRVDVLKLDEKVTEIEIDEWSEEDDNSISKGMRKLNKWEGDLEKITTMLRELKDLKVVNRIEENEVRYEYVENEKNKVSRKKHYTAKRTK